MKNIDDRRARLYGALLAQISEYFWCRSKAHAAEHRCSADGIGRQTACTGNPAPPRPYGTTGAVAAVNGAIFPRLRRLLLSS